MNDERIERRMFNSEIIRLTNLKIFKFQSNSYSKKKKKKKEEFEEKMYIFLVSLGGEIFASLCIIGTMFPERNSASRKFFPPPSPPGSDRQIKSFVVWPASARSSTSFRPQFSVRPRSKNEQLVFHSSKNEEKGGDAEKKRVNLN